MLLATELVNRAHRQRALHADEGAQSGVAGLQFHGHQPVFDRAAPCAAVAGEVHAEHAQRAQLVDQLAWEVPGLVPAGDVRLDPFLHEPAHPVAQLELLGREQAVEVKVIVRQFSHGVLLYAVSSMTVMPCPTSMHMVVRARWAPRSRSNSVHNSASGGSGASQAITAGNAPR